MSGSLKGSGLLHVFSQNLFERWSLRWYWFP